MSSSGSSITRNAPTIKASGTSALGDLTRLLGLFDPSTCTITLERVEDASLDAHLTAYGASMTTKPAGDEPKSKIQNCLEQASSDSTITQEMLHKQFISFARLGSYTTKSATTYGRLGLCVLESLTKEVGRFHFEWYRGVENLVHVAFGGFDYQWSAILREVKNTQPVLCDSLTNEECVKLEFNLENAAYEQTYQASELKYDKRVDEEKQDTSSVEEHTSPANGRADSTIIIGSPFQDKPQGDNESITDSLDVPASVDTALGASSDDSATLTTESKPTQPIITPEESLATENKKRKRSDDETLETAAGSAKAPREDSYRPSDVIEPTPLSKSPHSPAVDEVTAQATAGAIIDLTESNDKPRSTTKSSPRGGLATESSAEHIDLTTNSEELGRDAVVPRVIQRAMAEELHTGTKDEQATLGDDTELSSEKSFGNVEGTLMSFGADKGSSVTSSTALSQKRKAEDDGGQASKRHASEAGRSETTQSSITSTTQAPQEVHNSSGSSKIRRKPKQHRLKVPFKQCLVTFKWFEEDYTLKEDEAKIALSADRKFLNIWQEAEEPLMSIPTAEIKNLEYAQNEEDLVLSRDVEKTLILNIYEADQPKFTRTHGKFYNELELLANGGKGTDRLQKERADAAARKTAAQTSHNAAFMRQQWKVYGNDDWKNITKNDMKQFCCWVDETHADQPFRGVSNEKKYKVQNRIIQWLSKNTHEGVDAASAVQAVRPQYPALDENKRVLGYYNTFDEAKAASQEAFLAAAAARPRRIEQ